MSQTKFIVDGAVEGSIMTKAYDEAYELMEKLAFNYHQMMYVMTRRKNVIGDIQIDALNTLSAQVVALSKQTHNL